MATPVLLVGLVVFSIVTCTSSASDGREQGGEDAQGTTVLTPSDANATSSVSANATVASDDGSNVPNPAWKTAANVPDLTKSGTDPTAIAASMTSDRIRANEAQGYEGVEDPWVTSGRFTTGDKDLDSQVKKFCDAHATKGKSAWDNAYDTFCNITWSDYDEWEGNQHPHTYDWTVNYAKDFFSRGGNCFSMAAAMQWCLRYYGYSDAHAELTYQERQSGGWLDHGLTWVTDPQTGEIHMVDSELSTKGWMLPAGAYNVEVLDPTSDWEPRSSPFTRSEITG